MATATKHTLTISPYDLGHHLRIAAERYVKDREVMEQAGAQYAPVADTFRRMAKEAFALAEALQYGENVAVVGDEYSVLVTYQDLDAD